MKHAVWIRTIAILLAALTCLGSLMILPVYAEEAAELTEEEIYEAKKAAYREKLMADDITSDDLLIGSWVSFYSFDTDSFEYQLDQMAAAAVVLKKKED